MSCITVREATTTNRSGEIELEITAREHVVDGSVVRRLIPAPGSVMVGPFVSFDHITSTGPLLPAGAALAINSTTDVAALRYCFEGAAAPAANSAPDLRSFQTIQCWIALPEEVESHRPVSEQYTDMEIPEVEVADTTVRIVLGEAYGKRSPATRNVPILKLHCSLPEGGDFQLPTTFTELSIYVVDGLVTIDGRGYARGMMAIAATGWPVKLCAERNSIVMVIGGQPPRLIRKTHKWAWS